MLLMIISDVLVELFVNIFWIVLEIVLVFIVIVVSFSIGRFEDFLEGLFILFVVLLIRVIGVCLYFLN